MPVPIVQIDAFTSRPFEGNPAAVCVLPAARDAEWMQNVAREMNLSETAFLVRGESAYDLRWFTPATEVELCGHATLASAHALWEGGHLAKDETARFQTKSGLLTARKIGGLDRIGLSGDAANAGPAPERARRSARRSAEIRRGEAGSTTSSKSRARGTSRDLRRTSARFGVFRFAA